MQNWCIEKKQQGLTIGLVPTMGYLHEGHLALVHEAGQQCDIVVVSIFVNPTQFCAGEDFAEYPRDIERDQLVLERERVDAIFAPSQEKCIPLAITAGWRCKGKLLPSSVGRLVRGILEVLPPWLANYFIFV